MYLALALDKVVKERGTLTGDTFIRAFNLVRERKRPEEQSRRLVRDMDIAAWVEIATRRGLTRADAKSRAKDLFGLENIDRNLRNAGEVREVSERAYDELFVLQGRPLPHRQ